VKARSTGIAISSSSALLNETETTSGVPGKLLDFVCPQCRSPLVDRGPDEFVCPHDGERFQRIDGIWRFLLPERANYFQPFIEDYEAIRIAEGRGSQDAAYYRALPEQDLTGRFVEDWRIRSMSYRQLIGSVIQPCENELDRPLGILDLGAGNGWLSNRLAMREHDVAAVELTTNEFDGLGTHHFYESRFTPVQAEYDRLPFPDGTFDLVIFNGSAHYSTDYRTTLAEVIRVLQDTGHVVILDTPVYRDQSSGVQMIREREEQFSRVYGFPSNSLPVEGFLTFDRLEELTAQTGLHWKVIRPWYGLRWALRPWKAWILRRREPARFLLIVGQQAAAPAKRSTLDKVIKRLSRIGLRVRYRLLHPHRHRTHTLENVADYPIVVLPEVFNPSLFRSGAFLAETLGPELIPPGSTVLDMGTGTGIGAIVSARWAPRVVAVDINPEAVRCARINMLMNHVEDRAVVREGDLFAPVEGKRFDVVLFNPPYYRGEPRDWYDHAWRGVDIFDRFVAELRNHLKDDGYALLVLSSDGESGSFLASVRENGYGIQIVDRRDFSNEQMTIYRIYVDG
jgi:HemK-related putative methylase